MADSDSGSDVGVPPRISRPANLTPPPPPFPPPSPGSFLVALWPSYVVGTGWAGYHAVPRGPYYVAPAAPPIPTGATAWSYQASTGFLVPPDGHHPRAPLGVPGAVSSTMYSWNPEFVARPAGNMVLDSQSLTPVRLRGPAPQYDNYQYPALEGASQEYDNYQYPALEGASQEHYQYPALEGASQEPAQHRRWHPNDTAGEASGSARLDTETLIGFVSRVVAGAAGSGNNTWHDDVVRQAALGEASSSHWQRLIEAKNEAVVYNTVGAVEGVVFDVMRGEFGHHLFLSLVSVCRGYLLGILVHVVTARGEELVATAKHQHGMKCVRQLLLQVKRWRPMLTELITTALATDVVGLMMDYFGSRLLQACLSCLDVGETSFIHEGALNNLNEVAISHYGCLALTQCIDQAPAPTRHRLVVEVISNSVFLSQDLYGNYVVQHILALEGGEGYTEMLCRELKQHWQQLSTQKHGSHVMEKCMASSGGRHLLEELVLCRSPEVVALDPYGNFVVQRALDILKERQPQWYVQLANALKARLRLLRNHPIGKHIIKKLEDHRPE